MWPTGAITPTIIMLERAALRAPGAERLLADAGLTFPVLLRPPGWHTGRNLIRVERPEALADAAAKLPGRMTLAIEFLDTRGADGRVRKYRVMTIDGSRYSRSQSIMRSAASE